MIAATTPASTLAAAPRPHHHGNLREALIAASIELLNAEGPAGLTLRRAAARAGVSHAAPAHHFAGLPDLLTAVAARAFDLFTEAMREARRDAGTDPMARLQGVCAGYLRFAADHAGLFHVMFLTGEVDRTNASLMATSEAAYAELRLACLPFSSRAPALDPALEIAVWSLVHGYAVLGFSDPRRSRFVLAEMPQFPELLGRLLADRGAGLDLAQGVMSSGSLGSPSVPD
ncbi:TetR/AcrR family transcriptional regulator [Pannonibacter tanglangensis]|uniref:TetR family transcriptional regulator n=1 Tax=Pannonibacter tanglangensis TaxID=2750084 RepID=A0ABW9ZLQ6_9HYPH|nr:TetR/AcrR family transcriptional regulator [Pannonibacter sp. XCT-34]NBN65858.1 TetR family transcriptional regulator [Pannonibacter sp. XCT-34]